MHECAKLSVIITACLNVIDVNDLYDLLGYHIILGLIRASVIAENTKNAKNAILDGIIM
jgi:hypothetical protein